jgi:hypothetical protein
VREMNWEENLKQELTDMIFTFPNTETRQRIIEKIKSEIRKFAIELYEDCDYVCSERCTEREFVNKILFDRGIENI